jgi:hypothetical protein
MRLQVSSSLSQNFKRFKIFWSVSPLSALMLRGRRPHKSDFVAYSCIKRRPVANVPKSGTAHQYYTSINMCLPHLDTHPPTQSTNINPPLPKPTFQKYLGLEKSSPCRSRFSVCAASSNTSVDPAIGKHKLSI